MDHDAPTSISRLVEDIAASTDGRVRIRELSVPYELIVVLRAQALDEDRPDLCLVRARAGDDTLVVPQIHTAVGPVVVSYRE